MLRLMTKWGIPRHPANDFSNPFASIDVTLSPTMHAISRTKNCVQRLRHLIQLPGHHNINAAAVALGTKWSTLNYQLKHIKDLAGFTVIERSRPLATTADGRTLLTEARTLLNMLDSHSK
ncbi:LysR family transcriptional regulator [Streptomyces sp. NPDC087901]|uniref:helix-turn-helix domain-containing protein n=1 Tax=Streptomyces sp. NPDC087901 TaxID=3365818 RepID=UPI00382F323C